MLSRIGIALHHSHFQVASDPNSRKEEKDDEGELPGEDEADDDASTNAR